MNDTFLSSESADRIPSKVSNVFYRFLIDSIESGIRYPLSYDVSNLCKTPVEKIKMKSHESDDDVVSYDGENYLSDENILCFLTRQL